MKRMDLCRILAESMRSSLRESDAAGVQEFEKEATS